MQCTSCLIQFSEKRRWSNGTENQKKRSTAKEEVFRDQDTHGFDISVTFIVYFQVNWVFTIITLNMTDNM